MIPHRFNARAQAGFAYIAAIVLLVVVAGMAAGLVRLTGTQQSTVNQAMLGAKAGLAARAGIEWAFKACLTTSGTTNLSQFKTETGFNVSVDCQSRDYQEGERASGQTSISQAKRIVQIRAVACNGSAASCPDDKSVANAEYVERARAANICMLLDAGVPVGPCET
jgi:type II secretory pathway pseudopilin PulG